MLWVGDIEYKTLFSRTSPRPDFALHVSGISPIVSCQQRTLSLFFLLEVINDPNDKYPIMTPQMTYTSFTYFSHKVCLKILWLQTGWGWEGAGAIGMNCCNLPCGPHEQTIDDCCLHGQTMIKTWLGPQSLHLRPKPHHTRPTNQFKVCIRLASTLRASIPATRLSNLSNLRLTICVQCT